MTRQNKNNGNGSSSGTLGHLAEKLKRQVTIYHSEAFGVHKTEVTLINAGREDYAQYKDAPFIVYVPRGKRKAFIRRVTSYPYLLVLNGWGHLDPPSAFNKRVEAGGMVVTQTAYGSFDDRYKTDFDTLFAEYIKGREDMVLLDLRHTIDPNCVTNLPRDPQ